MMFFRVVQCTQVNLKDYADLDLMIQTITLGCMENEDWCNTVNVMFRCLHSPRG